MKNRTIIYISFDIETHINGILLKRRELVVHLLNIFEADKITPSVLFWLSIISFVSFDKVSSLICWVGAEQSLWFLLFKKNFCDSLGSGPPRRKNCPTLLMIMNGFVFFTRDRSFIDVSLTTLIIRNSIQISWTNPN